MKRKLQLVFTILITTSNFTSGQIPIKKFFSSTFKIDSSLHQEMKDSGFSYEFNRWIQVGDMNNDGKDDIIIQPYIHNKRRDGVISIFYNNSKDSIPYFINNKEFKIYTLGDPAQFTVGDINDDGKLDVLAPTENYHGTPENKSPFLYPPNGDYPYGSDHSPDKVFIQSSTGFKKLTIPENYNTRSGNLLDIEGNGKQKIIITNNTKANEDWNSKNYKLPAANEELFPDINWNDFAQNKNTFYDINGDKIPDIISYKRINNQPHLPPIFYINDITGKVLYSFDLKKFKPSVRDSLNNIIYDYDDINSDGKVDLVLSYMGEWWLGNGNSPITGATGRWFGINTFLLINKGDMEFDVSEIIDDPNNVQFNVNLSDFDFDGNIDILVSTIQEGTYYKNIGNNKFEKNKISPLFTQVMNLKGIDFDKDGKKDFINLYINEKDEKGNYIRSDNSQTLSIITSKEVLSFPVTGKQIEKNVYIGQNTTSAERLNMVDGDNDGDMDLIIGYRYTENGFVSAFQEYYENTGNSFVYKPNYIEYDKQLHSELQVWTYDVDKDGDLDLYYPTFKKSNTLSPSPTSDGNYFWWENTGNKFKINKRLNLNFTEPNILYKYDYQCCYIQGKEVDTLIRNSIFEYGTTYPPPAPSDSWKTAINIGSIRMTDPTYNYFAIEDWETQQKLDKIRILAFKKGSKLSISEKADTIAIIPIVEKYFTKQGRNDKYIYTPVNDWGIHIYDLDNDGKKEVITMEFPNYNGPYDIDMPSGSRIQVYDKTGNISEKYLDSSLQYDPQKISAANGITMTDLNGDGLVDILPFTGWGWLSWTYNGSIDFWPKIDSQRYIKRLLLNTGSGFKAFNIDLSNKTEDFIQQQIGYAHYYPFDFNKSKEKSIFVLKGFTDKLEAVPAIQLDYSQFKFPCISNQPKYNFNGNTRFCTSDSSILKIDSVSGYKTRWYTNGQLIGTKNQIVIKESGNITMSVTNLGGCTTEKVFQITKYPIPGSPSIIRDTANNLVASTNGITWYKDGIKISDTTQKIKPTNNGIYTATTTQNGCTSALSQGYYYLTNAIANLSNGEYFKISPNPTSGELNINYKISSSRNINISVFDINGRAVLLNKKVESGSKINLGSVSKGNYIIQVKDGAGRLIASQKLVKE